MGWSWKQFSWFFFISLFFVHTTFPIAGRAVLLGAERGGSKSQRGDINWDQNPELFLTWSITSCELGKAILMLFPHGEVEKSNIYCNSKFYILLMRHTACLVYAFCMHVYRRNCKDHYQVFSMYWELCHVLYVHHYVQSSKQSYNVGSIFILFYTEGSQRLIEMKEISPNLTAKDPGNWLQNLYSSSPRYNAAQICYFC